MEKVRKIEMDYSEKWGKDVEEAVRLALADLDVSRDQVDVIVLEEPSKGFFGIGSRLAKVRVEKKKVTEEALQQEVSRKKEPSNKEKERVSLTDAAAGEECQAEGFESVSPVQKEGKSEPVRKGKDSNRGRRSEKHQRSERPERKSFDQNDSRFTIRKRPDDLVETTDHPSLTFLREIIDKMGLSLTVCAYENDDSVYLDMDGKDSGTIIGKRGQTLDAIQYLTSLVVNKDSEKYVRVVVDAENYRNKREKTLEQLALRLAEKVQRSGKSVRLEPMNPYERKVIHAALQQNPNVTTRSEGEEPYRRVIIELK